jgi:hypothetical protein
MKHWVLNFSQSVYAHACLCLISFIYLIFHLIWGLHWHDVGEWISAGWMLAPAHPPSHPLAIQWIHLIEHFITFGDIAWRGQLSSAICMTLAIFFLARTIQIWLKSISPLAPPFDQWTGLIAITSALWCGILPLCWLQGIRAEVYALQTCLSAILIWAFSAYLHTQKEQNADQRYLLLAGFILGLLAVNHTLLTVCLSLPALIWLISLKLKIRVWLWSIIGGCFAFSHYLFVWIRGQKGGIWGWPWMSDLDDLWINLSAKIWQQQVQDQHAQVLIYENIQALIRAQIKELGIFVFLILMLISAFAIPKWFNVSQFDRSKHQPIQLFALFLVSVVICTLSTNFMYAYQPINPDLSGYFSAAMPAFVLLLILSIQRINPFIYLCLPLLFCIPKIDLGDRNQSHFAEKVATWYTESFESESVIWTSYYANHFNLIALQGIQGWRMDLSYLFRGQIKSEDYWQRQKPSLLYFRQNLKANHANTYFETPSSIDDLNHIWHLLKPKSFFWQMHHQIEPLQSDLARHELQSDLEQLQSDLKSLGLLRLSRSENKALKIDLDTGYSIAYFEMEQIRLIKMILPHQSLEIQEKLMKRLRFLEEQFDLWLNYLSEK